MLINPSAQEVGNKIFYIKKYKGKHYHANKGAWAFSPKILSELERQKIKFIRIYDPETKLEFESSIRDIWDKAERDQYLVSGTTDKFEPQLFMPLRYFNARKVTIFEPYDEIKHDGYV